MARLKKIQLFQRFWQKNIMQAEYFQENPGKNRRENGLTGFLS